MRIIPRILLTALSFTLLAISTFAQNRDAATDSSLRLTQSLAAQNGSDALTNEVAELRKSVQTLNERLKAIAEELLSPDPKENNNQKVKQIATNLELLTQTEMRAEILRKQLIELIEKETTYRTRLTQMDEDMRPENIERSMAGIGTTRTTELRDTRRRSLDSERRGLESLLAITGQSRLRLEEDVRQADQLAARFRQRLFPLIEKQLEKLNPY
jgi:Skp family chaperone for outer membrane proteins